MEELDRYLAEHKEAVWARMEAAATPEEAFAAACDARAAVRFASELCAAAAIGKQADKMILDDRE